MYRRTLNASRRSRKNTSTATFWMCRGKISSRSRCGPSTHWVRRTGSTVCGYRAIGMIASISGAIWNPGHQLAGIYTLTQRKPFGFSADQLTGLVTTNMQSGTRDTRTTSAVRRDVSCLSSFCTPDIKIFTHRNRHCFN